MQKDQEEKYIESEHEVRTFLTKLYHSIDNHCHIFLQRHKRTEKNRPIEYTNLYTINDLFPNEDITDRLKQELKELKVENYVHTIADKKFKKRSPLRVFGKVYHDKNVYIKIRVEILNDEIFVMSFHYAMHPFAEVDFPYIDCSMYGIEGRNNNENIKEV